LVSRIWDAAAPRLMGWDSIQKSGARNRESHCVLGSTGHWPVPSGDSPDGKGRTSPADEDGVKLGAAPFVHDLISRIWNAAVPMMKTVSATPSRTHCDSPSRPHGVGYANT